MADTKKGKTRLKGHCLWREGGAMTDNGFDLVDASGPGYAMCECDARSPHLPNRSQRQKWHREHKDAARKAVTEAGK